MAKDPKPETPAPEDLPQQGGSYTRNPDGSLTRNDTPAEEPEKE